MFKFFSSNPVDKLQKQYEKKLGEALDAQRSGKIPLYARLTAESESIAKRIDELEQKS